MSHYNILFLYISSINLRHCYLHTRKFRFNSSLCSAVAFTTFHTLHTSFILLSKIKSTLELEKAKLPAYRIGIQKRAEKDPQKHSDRDFLVNLTRQKKILKFFLLLLYINKGLWLWKSLKKKLFSVWSLRRVLERCSSNNLAF